MFLRHFARADKQKPPSGPDEQGGQRLCTGDGLLPSAKEALRVGMAVVHLGMSTAVSRSPIAPEAARVAAEGMSANCGLHENQRDRRGFFAELLSRSWRALNGYTHTGMLQLGRRFTGRTLEPAYGDGEIVEITTSTTTCLFAFVTSTTNE